MSCRIFGRVYASGRKKRRMGQWGLAYILLTTILATHAFAGVDMTIFGPKRFDRFQ